MSNFSNKDPEQDGLRGTFETIGAGGENGDELIFDPATGELRSARDVEDPDRVPATQMAREGFFWREVEAVATLPPSVRDAGSTPAPSTHGDGEELVFDSETRELQATHGNEAIDRVPATQMAREGFFCYGKVAKTGRGL